MSLKFVDGSQVDSVYESQISQFVRQACIATDDFSEDELERYADALRQSQLLGDSQWQLP